MQPIAYTAITVKKDDLKENQNTQGAHFVAFTDRDVPSETWEIRPAHKEFKDPNRNAKIHKIIPQKYFPHCRYSLWMDGAVTLQVPVGQLIKEYLQNADLAVFKHPGGYDCAYQEAEVCKKLELDNPELINRQMARYRAEGFPEKYGLAECTILLRRHSSGIRNFNDLW